MNILYDAEDIAEFHRLQKIKSEKEVENMTDADLTQFLVEDAIPQDIGNARMAYAAGYFESTLLSLMARFPEVRKEIEDRVNFRKGEAK
jgi:hypothetical protein